MNQPSARRVVAPLGLLSLATLTFAVAACAVAPEEDAARSQEQAWTTIPTGPIATFTVDPGSPPPPGWPHAIKTAVPVDCGREPAADEVIVATDENFGGACALLTPGFYPYPANLVVGANAISSIKVGAGVRARGFEGGGYAGSWKIFVPGSRNAVAYPRDQLDSFRIEPANRSVLCDDLRDGEIALFEDSSFTGDCVVLPSNESYGDVAAMGIENDSISSIRNHSDRTLVTFWDPGFKRPSLEVPPHTSKSSLPEGGWFSNGINDDVSSIQMR